MKTLVIGAAMIDMVMVMDRLPKSGEDKLCKDAGISIGGCAYNAASTLKNLDCDFDLCVPVGSGPYGAMIRNELERMGYQIVMEDPHKDNGFCVTMVEDNGERTFVTYQGIEGDFQPEWFEKLDMDQYESIYIAGYQVCNHSGEVIAEWLNGQKGKTIYFAPGPVICAIAEGVMNQILAKHPVLHINDKEAFDFTGKDTMEDCLKYLYSRTNNLVIVTLGKDGVAYYDGTEVYRVPGRKTEVVDTIGAGDSHIGAFMGARSKGKSVEESIRLANEVAAAIVGVHGPTMNKKSFMERMEKSYE